MVMKIYNIFSLNDNLSNFLSEKLGRGFEIDCFARLQVAFDHLRPSEPKNYCHGEIFTEDVQAESANAEERNLFCFIKKALVCGLTGSN